MFHDGQEVWTYGTKFYMKEALACIGQIFGCIPKVKTPLPVEDCYPKMDESSLLNLSGLIGMLQWLVTIGRPDLSHALTTLNRFRSCQRETHLNLAVRIFGYLK